MGLRFAFYGRMSTVDYQDRASSWRWQRDNANDLVAGHGRVVAEYFDEGVSRRVAWPDRPQAARLLAAVVDPARGFNAIVVGEYERAFHGQQLHHLAPVLRRHGAQLWLPETYGPVDFDSPRHLAMIDVLGVRSQREVCRARYRTIAAMRVQAEMQGRYLGGRPPYGYRLVDAGPHPNRVHAGWCRRLHRLDPDPVTAPHVRWIFEQRLAGRSVAGIPRNLNDHGVPCPSVADPVRNPHRTGRVWMVTTVAAILANPRYTRRQVWNRQPTDHDHIDPQGTLLGAQDVHTAPVPADGVPRIYVLAGLVYCEVCGRAMDSHWAHERAGYRCRHGHTSSRPTSPVRPKILYVREDQLLACIRSARQLRERFAELRNPDPHAMAACLRTHNMIIICGPQAWTVESDTIRIELAPTEHLPAPATATLVGER